MCVHIIFDHKCHQKLKFCYTNCMRTFLFTLSKNEIFIHTERASTCKTVTHWQRSCFFVWIYISVYCCICMCVCARETTLRLYINHIWLRLGTISLVLFPSRWDLTVSWVIIKEKELHSRKYHSWTCWQHRKKIKTCTQDSGSKIGGHSQESKRTIEFMYLGAENTQWICI